MEKKVSPHGVDCLLASVREAISTSVGIGASKESGQDILSGCQKLLQMYKEKQDVEEFDKDVNVLRLPGIGGVEKGWLIANKRLDN